MRNIMVDKPMTKIKGEVDRMYKTLTSTFEYGNSSINIQKDFIYSKYKSKIDLFDVLLDMIKIILTISSSLFIALIGFKGNFPMLKLPIQFFAIISCVLLIILLCILCFRWRTSREYLDEYEKLLPPILKLHNTGLDIMTTFLNFHKTVFKSIEDELKKRKIP